MSSYSIKDVGLVNRLNRAERDLEEMKSTQFLGRKVLSTKLSKENVRTESVNYTQQGSSAPAGSNIYRTITFTADNQTNPYGRLIITFYDQAGQQLINPMTSAQGPMLLYFTFQPTAVGDGKLMWNVDIRGPVVPHFWAEFSVAATDSGTVVSAPQV